MPPRLPRCADFPSSLKLTITPPPASSPQLTNVLILLHGLGDTLDSFTSLGRQLSLPETTCITIQAPTPLPFELGGFHFGDDILFDSNTGHMEPDASFSKIIEVLKGDVVEIALVQKCGYKPRDIMFFGFGQGGMAALATAASMADEVGGIISIGGPLPASSTPAKDVMSPVSVLGGSSNTLITRTTLERIKGTFRNVEYHKWNRPGDSMPRSRDEMLPIMQIFGKRLKSRRGIPEGSVEIG